MKLTAERCLQVVFLFSVFKIFDQYLAEMGKLNLTCVHGIKYGESLIEYKFFTSIVLTHVMWTCAWASPGVRFGCFSNIFYFVEVSSRHSDIHACFVNMGTLWRGKESK